MGNENMITTPEKLERLYLPIESRLINNRNCRKIWEHKNSSHYLEQHFYQPSSSFEAIKMQEILLTCAESESLVKVKGFWKEQMGYSIFTEKVVCDMSDFKEIPFEDTLYFYSQIFQGMEALYNIFGAFEPSE